jgi:hypothetical protein
VDSEVSATSDARMDGAGLTGEKVSSTSFSASTLNRWQLGDSQWYAGAGMKAENFSFSAKDGLLPSRLQDYAAQFSLERFEGDESVAALNVHPGFYFEHHASASAWDIPFDAFAGIPIISGWSGLIGLSNARFYHHALPAAGLIWEPTPHLRIEALYPEPAVVLTASRALSLRLGGELGGGGFRTDAPSHAGVVEYDTYRVGATLTYRWRQLQFALDAGVEVQREFDFFHQQQRVHGSGARYGDLSVEWAR